MQNMHLTYNEIRLNLKLLNMTERGARKWLRFLTKNFNLVAIVRTKAGAPSKKGQGKRLNIEEKRWICMQKVRVR